MDDHDEISVDAYNLAEFLADGEVAKVLAFLRAGGSGDSTEEGGKNALMYACDLRSPELLAALLAGGGKVDDQDDDQATALHHAARSGDLELVSLLVEAGADVEALAPDLEFNLGRGDDVYLSPLLIAGLLRHEAAFGYLASRTSGRERARVDRILRRRFGGVDRRAAALVRNAAKGDVEAVRNLLADGVGPDVLNGRGETPLVSAAIYRQPGVVALLLGAGADVGLTTDGGDRPIDRASDAETIRLLAAAGSDLDATDECRHVMLEHRLTPLMARVGAGALEGIRALLAAGAGVDAANSVGVTPLIRAAELGREEAVALLLESGADPTRATLGDVTPLKRAMARGDAGPIRLLAAALGGRLEEFDAEGLTPLASAVRLIPPAQAANVSRLLIAAGASIEGRTAGGLTPLMIAAAAENAFMIRALLDAGADPEAAPPDGRTAVDLVPPDAFFRDRIVRAFAGGTAE